MKRLVLGILAHVDAGKTTLSEALLYRAGSLRSLGRVDHGDAFLDTNSIERERGITIFSKQAVLSLPDASITLLDTPGHVDFSAEMERALQVLDCAVLVVSGVDGIQAHTATLWKLLERHRVPVFIFVNKLDLPALPREQLKAALTGRFGDGCIDFSLEPDKLNEQLALCGETMMEQYLETGSVTTQAIAEAVRKRQVFPCRYGSALRLDGIDELLSLIVKYAGAEQAPEEFGALVYKISEDQRGTRLTHMKITGGTLHVRDTITIGGDAEKAAQIRVYSGEKFQSAGEASAGMVCAVAGLTKTYPGQGLGCCPNAPTPVLRPTMEYRVILPEGADVHDALLKLKRLEDEDPQLHVAWDSVLKQISVRLMGEVQLEVLRRVSRERFNLDIDFADGGILYLETIAKPAEGVGHFEPLRHYAEVHLLMEPGERGSGLVFSSRCREDDLDKNWQRLILTHLEEKTHLGVLTGAPLTDVKVTLVAGRAHPKHTEGGDFRQATYRAVRQGARMAGGVLLEPWYAFRLETPREYVGRAMSDLQLRGAAFEAPLADGGAQLSAVIEGRAPVSSMRGYQLEVAGYTRGEGRLECVFDGYAPCHNAGEVIQQTGYDCDADLENTADSVFCSHGAGHMVKWDEVYSHMHCPLTLEQKREQQPERVFNVSRAADYCSRLAEDKELLAIFERTYGPIKRDPRAALRTERSAPAQQRPPRLDPLPPDAGDYLLVDGYNIIFAWEELSSIAKDNIDAARGRLIHILCNYQGFMQCKVIVVFDAYKIKGSRREIEQVHNISVVYTKEAETADMYIERATHELGKHSRVRVATSDALEQVIILGAGATRLSASSLLEEVKLTERAIKEYLASQR